MLSNINQKYVQLWAYSATIHFTKKGVSAQRVLLYKFETGAIGYCHRNDWSFYNSLKEVKTFQGSRVKEVVTIASGKPSNMLVLSDLITIATDHRKLKKRLPKKLLKVIADMTGIPASQPDRLEQVVQQYLTPKSKKKTQATAAKKFSAGDCVEIVTSDDGGTIIMTASILATLKDSAGSIYLHLSLPTMVVNPDFHFSITTLTYNLIGAVIQKNKPQLILQNTKILSSYMNWDCSIKHLTK